jgi:hypothetical protein
MFVGSVINGAVYLNAPVQIGDALSIGRDYERVRAIFDDENFSVSAAGTGSTVTILGVLPGEDDVYRFPNDRTARDWARRQ